MHRLDTKLAKIKTPHLFTS